MYHCELMLLGKIFLFRYLYKYFYEVSKDGVDIYY